MVNFIKNFQRKKEDFKCQNCGFFVTGNGYTNHCMKCLWSRHVDLNPGDRLETCSGMMKPIGSEIFGNEESLIHQCVKCGKMKKNKLSKDDNYDRVIGLGLLP